jgi:SAM-dependent MidA family methyltransferase
VGADGFWLRHRPGHHFRTAAGATGLLARMLLALIARSGISTVVDVGAGDGRLLAEVAARSPRLRLIGLDVRPAPPMLPRDAIWLTGRWDSRAGAWRPGGGAAPVPLRSVIPAGPEPMLIVCSEWLDDLPAVIAAGSSGDWHEVLVGPDGTESVGGPVPAADTAWLDRWWPGAGARAESGRTRDDAWSAVIGCLRPTGGLAVMIDYGHHRDTRPRAGSLAGYRLGRQVPPSPSPEINLTAHVAIDSLQAAGEAAGARTDLVLTQRQAVERLLPGTGRTERSDDTLARLQETSERRLLADTLGDHWWLVQSVDPAAPSLRGPTGAPAAE